MSERRSIMELEVKLGTTSVSANLEDDLAFSMDNINQAFIEQSAKFAYWSTLYAQARNLVESKKLEVDKLDEYIRKTLLGELDAKVREELDDEGIKITESKVQARIYTHPQYKAHIEQLTFLKQEQVNLQKQLYLLEAAKEAMAQRKDMLVSLGAMLRANAGNDVMGLR